MLLQLKNIDAFIAKRTLEGRPPTFYVYSATLKNERLRNNLTLGDLTHKICSKSYASKIENNLITPDEFVMKMLFERMNIDYDKLSAMDQTNYLFECLHYYFYHQFDYIQSLSERTQKPFFIARNALVQLFYQLIKQDYNQFRIQVQVIDDVKNTLDDFELLVLFFCVIEYFIKTHQYTQAETYLRLVAQIAHQTTILHALFAEQKFLVACHLNQTYRAHQYYQDLEHYYTIGYPIKKQFKDKLLFLETFYQDHPAIEEMKRMEADYIPQEYEQSFWYSQLLIMTKQGHYLPVMDIIIERNFRHAKFVALFGFCVKQIMSSDRQIEGMAQYRQQFFTFYEQMEYNEHDFMHVNFIKLMLLEIRGSDRYEILDYLKDYLIAQIPSVQHRFYTPYYQKKYVTFLGQHSRYKDAYHYMSENSDSNPNNLH